MDFTNLKLLFAALAILSIFFIALFRIRRKFFKLVKQIWNLKARGTGKISIIFYLLSLVTFVISLGDLRGPEEVVQSNIPNQRTLILIDNSMSMLVEDIRPNRISKAAIIAKHFVKNAYGHQISLSIFSDLQRKIVPFTDDVNILESRLGTMLSAKPEGGSNVSLALKEAFQYFKTTEGYSKGNILLITDGEEHGGVDVDIPEEISLAIVGIGTSDGGKIPVRNNRGNFLNYKKFNGVEIVSKLNKQFFENLVDKSKYAKVWFVESYSLPTSDILGFFKDVHLNSFSKGTLRSRPVLGYGIIVAAIAFYVLSVFFGRFKTFSPISLVLLVFMFAPSLKVNAQENIQEEEVKVDPYQTELVDRMRAGNITKDEKLKLAQMYLSQKDGQKLAAEIYNETLKDYDNESSEDIFNYATSLLKNNRMNSALEIYDYLKKRNEGNDELQKAIKEQVKLALNQQDQKKKQDKQKKDDQENKDNKDNKDQNKDQKDSKDQNKSGQDKKEDQQKKGDEKGEKKNQDSKSEQQDKNKKDKQKQDQQSDSNKGNKKEQQKTQQQQWKELEEAAKKKKRMKKANGVFKQIMNDDSQLQKKFIDTSAEGNNDRKDW